MSMEKLIRKLGKEILQQREDEKRILNRIAAVTSTEFAKRAAGVLDSKKHAYSFEVYLSLLLELEEILLEGMPPDSALDAIQTCWGAEKILAMWRLSKI